MHTDLTMSVLRAMLRIQRRRATVDLDTLLVRVGGTEAELRVALRMLEAAGFVDRATRGGEARLTMAGLAVAVAQIAPIATRARTARPVAKHRAA